MSVDQTGETWGALAKAEFPVSATIVFGIHLDPANQPSKALSTVEGSMDFASKARSCGRLARHPVVGGKHRPDPPGHVHPRHSLNVARYGEDGSRNAYTLPPRSPTIIKSSTMIG